MSLSTYVGAGNTEQLAGKYLTFRLADQSYGVSVMVVREIIRITAITKVPQMPDCVRGVINLRGKIIPVIDLRLRFGLPNADSGEHTCIVVVQVRSSASRTVWTGLVVDDVEEVANIADSDIEGPPQFGATFGTDYILGMAKIKGSVRTLLDLDTLLTGHAAEALT